MNRRELQLVIVLVGVIMTAIGIIAVTATPADVKGFNGQSVDPMCVLGVYKCIKVVP